MLPIEQICRNTLIVATAAVAMTALPALSAEATLRYPVSSPKAAQVINYTSGGVGQESQRYLEEHERRYNLKLTTAYKTGHYLANVGVTVADKQGNIVISTMTDGPFFYADLQPGTYQVSAQYDGTIHNKTVTITQNTPLREVMFYWTPSEPVDS